MIISRKYKFIFMHSRKCAGSSMEVLLNRYLGPDDIQVGSWPETLIAGGRMNKRALKDAFGHPSTWYSTLKDLSGSVLRRRELGLSMVINASIKRQYRETLGSKPSCPIAQSVMLSEPVPWRDYFKFSFVRNPYDFEISVFFWRTKGASGQIEFKEFLERKLDSRISDPEGLVPFPATNWPIYSVNNQVALDYIGRFENLNYDLMAIGERLGISLNLAFVPKAKSGIRNVIDPSGFYDEESKEMVSFLHNEELEYFGYEFPY